MKIRYLALFTALLLAANSFGATIFVRKGATGANNGTSWANAFTRIQPAIDAAQGGDEVWVAQGDYDEIRGGADGALIMKAGVAIYGGFAGTETALAQRDWFTNITTINGANGFGANNPATHVIIGASNAVLDGFTVRNGQADGGTAATDRAGGMDNSGRSNLVVRNCTFTNNTARNTAGAMLNSAATVTVDRCIFFNNSSLGTGNGGDGTGGAICNDTGGTATLTNCLFYSNSALGSGPQAGGGAIVNSAHNPIIINCTFAKNNASNNTTTTALGPVNAGGGGAILAVNGASVTIRNSVLWGDNGGPEIATGANSSFGSVGSVTVSNSIVQGGYAGTANLNTDPLFISFIGNDFRLQPGSPARNSGDNSVAPARDLLGTIRPHEVNVDRGAYEFDQTAPNCQALALIQPLPASGTITITGAMINDGSSDAGGIKSLTLDRSTFTCADVGSPQSVTLTVTDWANNSSSCVTTVDVTETIPPQILACAGDQTVFFNGACRATIPDMTGALNATDACGTQPVEQNPPAGTLTAVGATGPILVTFTVRDFNGNQSTCQAFVNLVDNTPPVINLCPGDQVLDRDAGDCDVDVPDLTGGVLAADNCTAGASISITQSPAAGTPISTNTAVTIFVRDEDNNEATCVVNLTLQDVTPPQITQCPPASDTLTLDGSCEVLLPNYAALAAATDSCGAVTITQSPAANSPISADTVVTVTATDISNNTATCTVNVAVDDVDDPVITSCPGSDTISLDPTCSIGMPDYTTAVTATDNCAVTSVTQDPAPGSPVTGDSVVPVTVTVADAFGNEDSCVISVTVEDVTGPVINLVGGLTINHECSTPFSDPGASAIDACEGDVSTSLVVVSNVDPNIVGSYQITYDAVDGQGNTATQVIRTVNVVDTTPPVLAVTGSQIVTHECSTEYVDLGATGTDTCDGDVTDAIQVNNPVDETSGVGAYTVTYTAQDLSNNQAIPVTRTVNVVDTTIPVITLVGTPTVVVVTGSPYVEQGANAADTCDSNVPVVITGSVNSNVPGTYFINYNATDDSGNSAVQVTRTVLVQGANNPPVILSEPQDRDVFYNETTTFEVIASSQSAITYQWYRNGLQINDGVKYSGTTTPILTVNNAANGDEGDYNVIVENIFGETPSADASLIVRDPGITQQPLNQNVCDDNPAVFTVTAVGSGTLQYQWFRNNQPLSDGANVTGSDTDTLTIPISTDADEGLIYVEVTGADGVVQSNTVSLTVTNPCINPQPQDLTVDPGDDAVFFALAQGTPPLVYQWRKNGINIQNSAKYDGVTTNTLTIFDAQEADEGLYSVRVVGQNIVTSDEAQLTVNDPPIIDEVVLQPEGGVTAVDGQIQAIVSLLQGTLPVSYQWEKTALNTPNGPWVPVTNGQMNTGGGNFVGATTSQLLLQNAQRVDRGLYRVVVSNSAGTAISDAQPFVVGLGFARNLFSVQVVDGTLFDWVVLVAGGQGNLNFEWQSAPTNSGPWTPVVNGNGISGASSTGLSFNPVEFADEAFYRVIVSDDIDTIQSNVAFLDVVSQLPAAGGLGLGALSLVTALAGAVTLRRKNRK